MRFQPLADVLDDTDEVNAKTKAVVEERLEYLCRLPAHRMRYARE
jgi:hypothetical protein